jgi:hypothetical protein
MFMQYAPCSVNRPFAVCAAFIFIKDLVDEGVAVGFVADAGEVARRLRSHDQFGIVER